jgi:TolB-like protein/cytochrome c-type biogenesis protein CcmH/NrfG
MAESLSRRRLAAILAADVAGYSRLMGRDEAGTLARLKAHRRELIEPLVAAHGGTVVKLMGDGALVEFPSVADAVECAVAVQRGIAEREADMPEAERIRFRIGVNLGDVISDEGDIYGDGVNVAARLQALAEPGGICIAAVVRDAIGDRLPLVFVDLGERELKNISRPVRVWQVMTADAGPTGVAPAVGSGRPSIAVMPFVNMGGSRDDEYLADGLTEDIITELARYRELLVLARHTTFAYKGKSVGVAQVARELGVAFVVEGSIRRAGDRLRVTAQLIDAASGGHVWAERFDRESVDLFLLQDEVTATIASTVVGRVEHAGMTRAQQLSDGALKAYDYVLRARAITADSAEANRSSRALYERALGLDPRCVPAWVGLGRTHLLDGTGRWTDDWRASLELALDADKRALQLDPTDPSAHRATGNALIFLGRHDEARAHLERARTLAPSSSDAVMGLAVLTVFEGRPEAAIGLLDEALRLDPHYPTNRLWFLGLAHYLAQDYAKALPPLREAIGRYPKFLSPRRHLIASLARLGRLDEAGVEVAAYLALDPGFRIGDLAPTLPYRDPAKLEDYLDGLRQAGLPE